MKKFQIFLQVVGMITMGLLAVYGLLALLGHEELIVASASKAFDPEAPSALAPSVINYQGTLRNIDGSLINAAFTMTFRLYDDPVGGNLLHSETIENVVVRDSLFTVLLGDTTSIDPEIFKGAVYVGVQVESDSEMAPRQRLAPVGFAVQLTDGVFVDQDGKVGIGTQDPQAQLDVNGDATIRGNADVSGDTALHGDVNIGTTGPDSTLEVNGTMKIFGDRVIIEEYGTTPSGGNITQLLHSSTADSDGFLIATVSIENMNGDYKLYGRVTGIGYDLGSAAVNWVSGQDYPILSNSFTMPVRKGETWEVWFYSEPVQNQHQHYSIYWIPLGQH